MSKEYTVRLYYDSERGKGIEWLASTYLGPPSLSTIVTGEGTTRKAAIASLRENIYKRSERIRHKEVATITIDERN